MQIFVHWLCSRCSETARLWLKFVCFAQMFVKHAETNAKSTITTIARHVHRRALNVQKHARRWQPDDYLYKSRRRYTSPAFVSLCYERGAHSIMATPARQIAAPIQSYTSGVFLSTPQPHKTDNTINTPPYAAYTRPNDGKV